MQDNTVVYFHSIDGVIFYIGCGNESRPYDKNGRNKKWIAAVENNDHVYDISIVSTHTERESARTEESKLIRLILPECNISGRKCDYKPSNKKGFSYLNVPIRDDVKDKLVKVSKESGVIIMKIVEIALLDYFKRYKK